MNLPYWNADMKDLECFSRIKLIFSDIDGTLLTGNSLEHEKFINLVRYLKTRGIHLSFATGRTFSGVSSLIDEIPVSSKYPMILYNGSLVVEPKSQFVIYSNTLDNNAVKQLIDIANKANITILFYCIDLSQTIIKIKKSNELVFAFGKHQDENIDPNGQHIFWDTPIPKGVFCLSAMIYIPNNQILSDVLESKLLAISFISFTKSSSNFLEIRPKDSNKGLAAQKICKLQEINKEEVMTIGDNDNDIEMFECFNISIAVNNSSQRAKEKAKYISNHNSLLGVNEALELVKQASIRYKKNISNEN